MVRLDRIRLIARKKRIQLKEIAEYLEITPAGMQHILKSNTTSVTTLFRISNFLKVPISTFFDEAEEVDQEALIDGETTVEEEITPVHDIHSLFIDIELLKHAFEALRGRVQKLERI